MRLDKYIASVTDLSRKQVRTAIRARQVLVNGELFTDPACHVEPSSEVRLDVPQPGGGTLPEGNYRLSVSGERRSARDNDSRATPNGA